MKTAILICIAMMAGGIEAQPVPSQPVWTNCGQAVSYIWFGSGYAPFVAQRQTNDLGAARIVVARAGRTMILKPLGSGVMASVPDAFWKPLPVIETVTCFQWGYRYGSNLGAWDGTNTETQLLTNMPDTQFRQYFYWVPKTTTVIHQ